ncbi:MAG: hypothetical protein JO253_01255 [Alphaproteobacteria bacterium]|nr:hypothetical protein [Alphaproteobacteria bacterium]
MEQFCSYLNSIGAEGVFTILLDMYSKQPVAEAVYHAGQPFTDVCPYFDGNYTWRNRLNPRLWQQAFPPMEPIGGPRLRLFYPEFLNKGVATYTMAKIKRALRDKAKKLGAHLNMECAVPPLLFKVPLIKATGQHLPINPHKTTPLRLADVTTALLHFKFFSFFHEYAAESVARKQHFDGASEYKRYLNVLKINPTISLYGAASTLYEEPETLVKHNIMQTSNAYETYATRRKAA